MRNDEWSEFDRDSRQAAVRGFGWMGVFVIAILVLIVVIGAFTFVWAPWKGAIEQRNQTQGSGSYRIAAYDHFYDLCGDIQAKEDQIANVTANPPANADVILLALNNSRNSLIREYNADARKADTLAHFKASDLPYQIDPTEESTSC